MKISTIKQNLSFVPLEIRMFYNDQEISLGTAFFYEHEGKDFLVTNWHNVTGRNPTTKIPLSRSGGIPNKLQIIFPINSILESGQNAVSWSAKMLDLYEDEELKQPVWWEHPEHREAVDVVVIELEGLNNDTNIATIKANGEKLNLDKLDLIPGMDAYVLGYPRGLTGGAKFPVWKRASLASEPDIDIGKLPKLYIDTATKEGMSGSPVYAQETGYWIPEGKTGIENGNFGRGHRFIGVYSGRVGDDVFEAQLGIVWKESAIIEIVNGTCVGKSSFEAI